MTTAGASSSRVSDGSSLERGGGPQGCLRDCPSRRGWGWVGAECSAAAPHVCGAELCRLGIFPVFFEGNSVEGEI